MYVNWALSSLKRLVWGGAEANNVKRAERQITQGVLPQMSQSEFEGTKILLQVLCGFQKLGNLRPSLVHGGLLMVGPNKAIFEDDSKMFLGHAHMCCLERPFKCKKNSLRA